MQPRPAQAVEGGWVGICKNWYSWSHPISSVFWDTFSNYLPHPTTCPGRLYELFVVSPLGFNWEQEFQTVCNFLTGFDEIIFFHLDNVLGCWSHHPFPSRHTATTLWSMWQRTIKENDFSHLKLPVLFISTGIWNGLGLLAWVYILEGLLEMWLWPRTAQEVSIKDRAKSPN